MVGNNFCSNGIVKRMKRSNLSTLTLLGLFAIAAVQRGAAQGCTSSVAGYYSYSSIGNGKANSTTTTGTTTTTLTSTSTDTEVGKLLKGLSGTNPFSTAGTLFFDSGTISASSSPNNMNSQAV